MSAMFDSLVICKSDLSSAEAAPLRPAKVPRRFVCSVNFRCVGARFRVKVHLDGVSLLENSFRMHKLDWIAIDNHEHLARANRLLIVLNLVFADAPTDHRADQPADDRAGCGAAEGSDEENDHAGDGAHGESDPRQDSENPSESGADRRIADGVISEFELFDEFWIGLEIRGDDRELVGAKTGPLENEHGNFRLLDRIVHAHYAFFFHG